MRSGRLPRNKRLRFLTALALALSALAQGPFFTARAEEEAAPAVRREIPLIDIRQVHPRIRLDIRYATDDNFMKEKLYPEARCLLRHEVAAALSRVQEALEKKSLGLKVFDGYRPLSVQKKMWARFPVEGYVADPAKGSNHNRGAAVDLTLVDAAGNELPMPSAYDEFSERAHQDYMKASAAEIENRAMLRTAMEAEGFTGLSTEWWHFDFKGAKALPVLDLPFERVASS